jgi:hypothetical protein
LVSSNFWPLCSLSFIDLCLLIKPLVSSNFWPMCSLSIIDLCLLINPLVFSNFGHCVLCPSLICVFWLTFWYLQTFGNTMAKVWRY